MKAGKISDPQGLVYALGRKNVLINGSLDVWQRGISFAAIADGSYFADMWYHIKGTTAAAMTITRDTNVPTVAQAGFKFSYSIKCDVTTADASVASNDVVSLQTKVEGLNARHLVDKICTLSFWVSSPKTGAHSVSIVSYGSDRVYPFTYTVNSANTWEKKTKTFTLDVAGGGTWAWDTNHAFKIRFPLMAGSDYANGTDSTWGTTGLYGVTSGQANVMDSTDNNFYLAGLQLELGSTATEFDYRSYSVEHSLCQRYLLKFGGQAAYEPLGVGFCATTAQARVWIEFPVEMRAAPAFYTTDSSKWQVRCTSDVQCSSVSLAIATTRGADIVAAVASGLTAGGGAFVRANNDTAAYILLYADL